jgi:uncharacterized protein (TIGR03437 family)
MASSRRSLLFVLSLLGLAGGLAAAQAKPFLSLPQALTSQYQGSKSDVAALKSGDAAALSAASGDFDHDGVLDLAAGYAGPNGGLLVIYRGNPEAFAPQTSFEAIGQNRFPSPYLSQAQVIDLPFQPDFLAAGEFTDGRGTELIAASRGGTSVYVLGPDSTGKFQVRQTVSSTAAVTSLDASGRMALAGASDQNGPQLLVLSGSASGLYEANSVGLSSNATAFAFGNLDGDSSPDAVVLSGGALSILHGATQTLEPLDGPSSVAAVATGSFVFDRNAFTQIAWIGNDGSAHILAHDSFDSRSLSAAELSARRQARFAPAAAPSTNGVVWKEIESDAGAVALDNSAVLFVFRARMTGNASDDLAIVNGRRLSVLAHTNQNPGAGVVFTRGDVPVGISAAIAARVNIDARAGLVFLTQNQAAPAVMLPVANAAYFVNRFDDPAPDMSAAGIAATCNNASESDASSSCSLRQAAIKANSTDGTDTILVAAGTYTLAAQASGARTAVELADGVNIVGASEGGTILQAASAAGSGIDAVFAINAAGGRAFDTSITNLTVRYGGNSAIDWDAGGSGSLIISNATISDSSSASDGGGIAASNVIGGPGQLAISNSVIRNNTAQGDGGGIAAGAMARVAIANSQISGNRANNGAGVWTESPVALDQGTAILDNSAIGDGGGLWQNAAAGLSTISRVTFTGNAAGGDGGAIHAGGSVGLSMRYSRLANNKAATGGNAGSAGAVDAIDNWWGTNLPDQTVSGGVAFEPFITLQATASKTRIKVKESSIITASFAQDSNGTAIDASNLTALIGLPTADSVFAGSPEHGTFSEVQSSIQANGMATEVFTAKEAGKENIRADVDATALDPDAASGALLLGAAPAIARPAVLGRNRLLVSMSATPPTIFKSFSANTVSQNSTVFVFFLIQNPNSSTTLTGVSFTDALPAGLVVATPNSASSDCGGTLTAVSGGSSISFSGGTITPPAMEGGGTCNIAVNLLATGLGTQSNTTGPVSANESGPGSTSNTATVNVVAAPVVSPPTLNKAFGAAAIPVGGTTSLTFNIANPNSSTNLTNIGFSDTLPSGLTVATPNGVTGTCLTDGTGVTAGSVTATSGTNFISLNGLGLDSNASCSFSVNVTGIQAGTQVNTTGQISGTFIDPNTFEPTTIFGGTATASILVQGPPSISKAFNPPAVAPGATTQLTFTIANPAANPAAESGVAFSDTLPAGLTVGTGTQSGCGGTVTLGVTTISLSGGTIAVNSSCQFSVAVTAGPPAVYTNVSGAVSSTNGGTGNSASASLTVAATPSIVKSFGAVTIPVGAVTSLSFTITNPNAIGLTGVNFSDTLPSGLVVAPTPSATNNCGGTFSPTAGASTFGLTGGTLAANSSCTLSVNVQGVGAGHQVNVSGPISSNESGSGGTATASIEVVAPPQFSKAFSPSTVTVGGTTALTFTLINPAANTVALTGVAFTDVLPFGMILANPVNASNNCGGSVSGAPGTNIVTFVAGAIAVNTTCTITLNVTGTFTGPVTNTTGAVSSTNGGTGGTATAVLNVAAGVVVQTSPPGLTFIVDNVTYTTTQVFQWSKGSTHTIATLSPQTGGAGTQFAFNHWSDGGGISHLVTAPAIGATFTAFFDRQFLLTTGVTPDNSGSVSPGTGFVTEGSVVNLRASANACFTFSTWSGPVTSPRSAATTIQVNSPVSAIALFNQLRNCGGDQRPVLTLVANPLNGGTATANPPPDINNSYALGTIVQISAKPNSGFIFLGFSGDLAGTTVPQNLLMNGNKVVVANFAPIPPNPNPVDFGFQTGSQTPPPQTVPLVGQLLGVIPLVGGNWLNVTPGVGGNVQDGNDPAASSVLQLSLNQAVVSKFADGIYTTYVAVGSYQSPNIILVRLLVNTVQVSQVADSAGYHPALIASNGLFTAFGVNLSNKSVAASSATLPDSLAGTSLTITDQSGRSRKALLSYVSPGQINFLSPGGLASGVATITVTNSAGQTSSYTATVANVAPGLYSADASGKGAAAAVVTKVAADGKQTNSLAADCTTTPGKCVTAAIDLGGAGDRVFVSLYGTGIRGVSSLDNVAIIVGGVQVTPLFAGDQSQYPGLDQINFELPRALAGRGEVDVLVSLDGHPANAVRIAVR